MRSEANSAPNIRRAVDALKASKALSEATHFCAELDELHELRTRVAELEGALKLARADADDQAETIGHLIRERDELQERADDYRFERNNLASDLADLREAHQVTVNALARYRRRDGKAGW